MYHCIQDDFAVGKPVIETAGDSGHSDGGGGVQVTIFKFSLCCPLSIPF